MFDTTIAGSLPKPCWLAQPEQLFASWRLKGDELELAKRDAAYVWLKELGVIDVASDTVELPEQVLSVIEQAMQHADAERILPCTNCGMAPLDRRLAQDKVTALAQGAQLARQRHGG